MNVLVACEFSGVVRDSFRDLGHEAWSCDLEDVEPQGEYPNYHLFGDCLNFLSSPFPFSWDLLIAHPPCTFLCVSGNRWMRGNESRIDERVKAINFFWDLWSASIPRIAIENPISIISSVIRKPDQIIQPWQFGHGETKATCLWLKNLPKLECTDVVSGRESRIHTMAPSKNRSKERSITYLGIAQAMAQQWGSLSEDKIFTSGLEPVIDPFGC